MSDNNEKPFMKTNKHAVKDAYEWTLASSYINFRDMKAKANGKVYNVETDRDE
jgi:hypothetical protein